MARSSVSPLGGTPDSWTPLPKIRGLNSPIPISREVEAYDYHMRNKLACVNAENQRMLVFKDAAQVVQALPQSLRCSFTVLKQRVL